MQVPLRRCSAKKFVLLSLLFIPASGLDLPLELPAPSLTQEPSARGDAVELFCQAPRGHAGVLFKLYRLKELVDSADFRHEEREGARFSLKGEPAAGLDPYCCLYQNLQGTYSQFSRYLDLVPAVSTAPLPQPVLTVEPQSGRVARGEVLSFHCSAPPSRSPPPHSFLLLKRPEETAGATGSPVTLVSHRGRLRSQEVSFTVGPVSGVEGGWYSCLYQMDLPARGPSNSTASEPVRVTVSAISGSLPAPSLSLLHEDPSTRAGDSLECMGSPSYPGARFSLFRLGSPHPAASRRAPLTHHSVRFPLPVHRQSPDQYRCQYSVRLGPDWGESELSPPLAVPSSSERTTDTAPDSPAPPKETTDWPLLIGSVAAGLLFLVALAVLGISVHRKVKVLEEKRRRREEARFWAQLHSMDRVVDLKLDCVSIDSLERYPMGTAPNDRARLQERPLSDAQHTFSTFSAPPVC